MPSICGRITTLCSESTVPMPLAKRGTSFSTTLTTRTGMALGALGLAVPGFMTNQRARAARATSSAMSKTVFF
jgi:hypothetical protein